MPKVFTSKSQKTGELGENIACMFLMKHGFAIVERNYTQKWGEIDIVAEKGNDLYFVEVKSVSCENIDVRREDYRPEENMHEWKIQRLSRTVESYIMNKNIPDSVDWQIDLLVVYMDHKNKKARVERIENVI